MLRSLSATELAEYEALYSIEPWGTPAEDYRHAVTLRMLAHSKKPLRDFLPYWRNTPTFNKPDQKTLTKKILAAFGLVGKQEKES